MSYKNITGFLGHRWIGKYDIDTILKEFPASEFDVDVSFTDDRNDIPLKDCTGRESNIDAITIYYKDGTCRRDPNPYRRSVTGPVNAMDFLESGIGDRRPKTYFFLRSKNRTVFPNTRNEDPETFRNLRRDVREKFVHWVHMDGMESALSDTDGGTLRIPVNCFAGADKKNLLRFIETLDTDGIQTFLTVHFERSTSDQLQRLDTEMEFGDLGEVLAIAEESNPEY